MKQARIQMMVNNRNVVVNDRLLILFYFLIQVFCAVLCLQSRYSFKPMGFFYVYLSE